MKLTYPLARWGADANKRVTVDAAGAVAYVVERAAHAADDTLDRMRYRTEALEQMLGRTLEALTANGQLRAEQIETIFGCDVMAED